jgi:hypothetical protein
VSEPEGTAEDARLIALLLGHKVESVVFVMDYVQITLWGPQSSPRMTFNVWPRIETFGEPRTYGDPGYRDALCGLIGRTVTVADESEADGLVLHFDADRLVVNPEPFEVAGPEIAMLAMNDDEGTWTVWRPGEGPFANREW